MPKDKEILYMMLQREVYNALRGTFFAPFSDIIWGRIEIWIEPYIDAFMNDQSLNTEQLSAFAAQEINERVAKFKANYEAKRSIQEDDIC